MSRSSRAESASATTARPRASTRSSSLGAQLPALGAKLSAFEAVPLSTSRFNAQVLPLSDTVGPLVNEARDLITALGGVEAHVAYGDATEELGLYSASLDLLIVGSLAYGPIGRQIHGSTSTKLAHMARCPLLVLPCSARAVEAGEAVEAGREPAVALKG
jgi:nucleotide-binding universal stress UspA family protein